MEAGRIAGWVAAGRERLGEQAQPAWERGAGLSITEAAAMARRGRGPRRRPAFGWSSLTPAERNVADLVACGLTNPEIAARLGVSAGTCLAMAFEHDCWFPPRSVREAAKRIPACQYTELPGLGHGAPLLASGQVNPILAAFLD